MTFLPLPCRNCGAQRSVPAFRYALRKAWGRRIGRWILAVAYLLIAGGAALKIWPPLAALIAVGTAAALGADLIRRTAEGDTCFWLFHDSTRKKKLPPADAAGIEALTDAYDMDLRRLEQMLELEPSPECAERVFYMAQSLTGVFHNRRVSALLANCLTFLPVSEGICVDLDQICAWLEPEDVSPKTLVKLAECARSTCLPAGEPTARFVGRFCAFRVQELLERVEKIRDYLLDDIPEMIAVRIITLKRAIPSKEERTCLASLWNLAGILPKSQTPLETAPPPYSTSMKIGEIPAGCGIIADYWFRTVWRQPDNKGFQEMEELFLSELSTLLKNNWQKGGNSV